MATTKIKEGNKWIKLPTIGIQQFPDAPLDGKPYNRKDGQWVEVEEVSMTETVIISLASNQGISDSNLDSKTITVSYVDTVRELIWEGQAITLEVPVNATYTIKGPTLDGYNNPDPVEYTAMAGNTRNVSLLYKTTLATFATSADDASSVGDRIVTVTNTEDGSIIHTGTVDQTTTLNIPFGIIFKIAFSSKVGYRDVADRTFTADVINMEISTVYEKIMTSKVIQDDSITDPENIAGDVNGFIIQQIRSKIRRCLAKKSADGEMTICYLQQNNSNSYNDSTAAKLDGTEGDVMVYFPKYYYKYESLGTYKFSITYSLEKIDSTWIEVPEYLIGAYEAYMLNSRIYSRSGVPSTGNVSQANFKIHARGRGKGYQLIDYDQHKMIAWLFYAIYGNRNCQSICGSGTNDYQKPTGQTNTIGDADTDSVNGNTMSVNFLGLENCWGNKYEWLDNAVVNPSYNDGVWRIADTVTGRTRDVAGIATQGSWAYPKAVVGGPNLDIVAREGGMSDSTGYCDGFLVSASTSRVVLRSSSYARTVGGVACADANNDSSNTYAGGGSRLAFRGVIRQAESVNEFKAISVTD